MREPTLKAAVLAVLRGWRPPSESLADKLANELIETVNSWHSDRLQVHYVAHREAWEDDTFREMLRTNLRHRMLEEFIKAGVIPVALPRETVTFHNSRYAQFDTNGNQAVQVWSGLPEESAWDQAQIVLEVGTRPAEEWKGTS